MSTHRELCIVCEKPTFCTDDARWWLQGTCYSDKPPIAFCSDDCARFVEKQLRELPADPSEAPDPEAVVPTGPVFPCYPKDTAAYVDEHGNLVVRRRWFDPYSARELAGWILAHVTSTHFKD